LGIATPPKKDGASVLERTNFEFYNNEAPLSIQGDGRGEGV